MKNIFIPIALFFMLATGAIVKVHTDKASATVEQKQGLYIFSHSKPVAEYEFLGEVSPNGIVKSKNAEPMLNLMMKTVKEKYPTADAIIVSDDYFKVEVIKFK